uniref:hypothetical protein n=1 Tax=uncultured Sphingomonas sp. TaxID=158754 RepID=UPI0035CAB6C1
MLTEPEIQAIYQLLLGRAADEAGLAHYGQQDSLTLDDLRNSLTASLEYKQREITTLADALYPHLVSKLLLERPWRNTMFVPSPEVYVSPADAPFMPYSTCSSGDFLHPAFADILAELGLRNEMHRKLWEWVFIIHHLRKSGRVGPGRRGLVFGVGRELLPALFAAAGASITATDAPIEIGVGSGWQESNEFSSGLAAMPEGKLARADFENLVEWRECDMNAIDPALTGYEFCWSSCCFEHLGSLRHGMDFVLNSVEHTLAPGGVAVHTTEFNLTSNDATIEAGATCIYRRRDIEQLITELRARGHAVEPFRVAPDSLVVDGYVDLPPYGGPHLKLLSDGFVATSIGLVITRRGS